MSVPCAPSRVRSGKILRSQLTVPTRRRVTDSKQKLCCPALRLPEAAPLCDESSEPTVKSNSYCFVKFKLLEVHSGPHGFPGQHQRKVKNTQVYEFYHFPKMAMQCGL